ncbi:MAG: DNA topoisomerase IV subunit A [Bacilli bacterium]
MKDIIQKIYDYSLEEIIGERFGSYSKYIIQDRAIPDIRDGLKPVQRRILYAMYKDKNTYDKAFRKSAKTVGNVMANYHPHGDSSIYDAMVRMSQDWKQKEPYIEMHGNNGSIDGDTAAAMRYTEARLSKISNELLKGIERDTVVFAPNFDDTELEPTVLPGRYPNLLVNGATGISAGYATNIPPHNLGELIEATIKRIDVPNCRLETIMDIVKGPDFPTGGIVQGLDGIKSAYTDGKGKIIIKSKIEHEKNRLVITEIPYEVNKANLVAKMDEIRIDKKIEGINEVRDESDREGLRIVIELKKDAKEDLIEKYLLKNTELQVPYAFNIIAIVGRRPKQLGLLEILDAYIAFQIEVITKRTQFDLAHMKKRLHIVEGLIKALSILDEVIKTIRKSKNKSDAKDNLVKEYNFTVEQAEAIVMLQLYKLTNTDVTLLEEELNNLINMIKQLTLILENDDMLKKVIKNELREIKKTYKTDRKTVVEAEIEEIKIDTIKMIPKEDVIVAISKDGYVKQVSTRSYSSSEGEFSGLKDGDYLIGLYEMNTRNTILLFTDLGNYLYVPVYELPDAKWKELGKHISNIIKLKPDENIIGAIPIYDFKEDKYITIFTKKGMVKRTSASEFEVQRYSKPMMAIKLKDNDKVTNVSISKDKEVFITTHNGYGLRYKIEEIPLVGTKTSGVKSISLKQGDYVVSGNIFENSEYLSILTDKGTGKRIKLSEIEPISRAKRGVLVIREVKTNPHKIISTYIEDSKDIVTVISKNDTKDIKLNELPICDRYSTGSSISKSITNSYLHINLEKNKDNKINDDIRKEVSLEEIDEKILTIDDFLDDMEI